jgi:MtN3 and saliva related transmembrane protein
MLAVTALGFAAACCTTICFVPQVVKTWRTRSTGDISLGMFALMTLGILLWLIYAALRSDLPLFAANAVTLCLAGTILVLKLRHG